MFLIKQTCITGSTLADIIRYKVRSLLMTGVGTEDKGGVTEKIGCVRWDRRTIFDNGGSVKTCTIFKHKCTLALLFSFGGVKKI